MNNEERLLQKLYNSLYFFLYDCKSAGVNTAVFMRDNNRLDGDLCLVTDVYVYHLDKTYSLNMREFINNFREYILSFDETFVIFITEKDLGFGHFQYVLKW